MKDITERHDYCGLGKHLIVESQIYVYRDEKNGIVNDVRVCKPCYLRHLFKYYPNSDLTKWYCKNEHESWMDEFIQDTTIKQQSLFEVTP